MLPEHNKQPGVYYAYTPEGTELPVIDVTHPAFTVAMDATAQQSLTAQYMAERPPFTRLPGVLRRPLLDLLLRGSALAQGMRQSRGSVLPGLATYRMKLGPDMLGAAWAKPMDRRIAAAFPVFCMRVRLQDMAELMAAALRPALAAAPQAPVLIADIAGGPASSALNALILLAPGPELLLAKREVCIDVLDRDTAGPAFALASLQALSAPGAPLAGVRAHLRHVPYDWSQPETLAGALRARASGTVTIACSEGGLFEYGSDEEIMANLRALRGAGGVTAVAGSVTRADAPTLKARQGHGAATRPRGLPVFGALAAQAGWTIQRALERPFGDHILLTPA